MMDAQQARVQVALQKPASWDLYFGQQEVQFTATDRRALLTNDLIYAFSSAQGQQLLQRATAADGRIALDLDLADLQNAANSADLAIALQMQPAEALACIACAAQQVSFQVSGIEPDPVAHCQLAGAQSLATFPSRISFYLGLYYTLNFILHSRGSLDLQPRLSVTLQALSEQLTCMHQPEMVDVRLSNHPESMRQIRQLKSSTIGEPSLLHALLLCVSGNQSKAPVQTWLRVPAGRTANGAPGLL